MDTAVKARYKLHKACQGENENMEQFEKRLIKILKRCRYDPNIGFSVVQDRLLFGARDFCMKADVLTVPDIVQRVEFTPPAPEYAAYYRTESALPMAAASQTAIHYAPETVVRESCVVNISPVKSFKVRGRRVKSKFLKEEGKYSVCATTRNIHLCSPTDSPVNEQKQQQGFPTE